MSMQSVKEELVSFLKNRQPGVFVVKGKWGVGKTYLVRGCIDELTKGKLRSPFKYAYVSLFGKNSLDEISEDIFVEMQGQQALKKGSSWVTRAAESSGLPYGEVISKLATLGLKAWAAHELRGATVCIDDLERKGDSLRVRDLLGYMSQLAEQNECQLILIFNEGELNPCEQQEYERYREKVVSREIELVPDIESVIELGLNDQFQDIAEPLRQLGVHNIRALQKCSHFLMRLKPFLDSQSNDLKRQVFHSAIVLGWFYYARSMASIPWDYLREFDGYAWNLRVSSGFEPDTSNEEEKKKQEYTRILNRCGYHVTGNLEKILVAALEKGFYAKDDLEKVLSRLRNEFDNKKANTQLSQAWKLFHNSFEDNEQEFVDKLLKCFEQQSVHLEPSRVESALRILEDLDRGNEAERLFELWTRAPHTFEISLSSVHGSMKAPKHPKVREYVDEIIAKTLSRKSARDIISNMASGWDATVDIPPLLSLTEDDWYDYFKQPFDEDEELHTHIWRVLEFGNFQSREYPYKEIAKKAREALQRIAKESDINKLRLERYHLDGSGGQ